LSPNKSLAMYNATSAEVEEEFNRWYNEVHIPAVLALPNICGVTWDRAKVQIRPSSAAAPFKYFNIYDLIDHSAVAREIAGKEAHSTPSDAIAWTARSPGFSSHSSPMRANDSQSSRAGRSAPICELDEAANAIGRTKSGKLGVVHS
jgi:hypothetical protein